ncbi:hypothetical protein P8452_02324 [Trifolium repens]|nr:hypothetical protein P8452_02324 [Trifolium repens]
MLELYGLMQIQLETDDYCWIRGKLVLTSFSSIIYTSITNGMDKGSSCSKSTCFYASKLATNLRADGMGTTCGKLYIGTAENMPSYELIDTTGAGDAFAGAVLYAICANFATEKMLCFAANVAAAKCRALGAQSGGNLIPDASSAIDQTNSPS